jgi:hypothetical protein
MLQRGNCNKASAVLNNFIRTKDGLFCEKARNYGVNKPSLHILNEGNY